ncbi:MAG: acyltransferase family protein, partial [Rikenellaceae bacterium]|nr:acyltransferase family protein [Rikenellaceae bacterium]
AERPMQGKMWKTIALGIILWVAGFLVTWSGQSAMAARYDYAENPAMLELFWQYCSPNVALMTIGVFIIIRRVNVSREHTQRVLSSFTRCSFGSYLIHYLFIGPFTLLFAPLGLPVPASVALIVVCVVAASWLTTAIIYRLTDRAARYIVG